MEGEAVTVHQLQPEPDPQTLLDLIRALDRRLAALETDRPMSKISPAMRAALNFMSGYPLLMLGATEWSRNSGGQFGDDAIRSLARIGLVDRLDLDGVQDAGGRLYRINQQGRDAISERVS